MSLRAALVAAIGLAVLLAGCAAPGPVAFVAWGGRPAVFAGYDYDAATLELGNGSIALSVDAAADTGSATAGFTFRGQEWSVAFERFEGTAPFHEGGIRNDFPEHGATGNGDTLLPEIHALSAGWGTGTVRVAGQPLVDPLTGHATYRLHYMVTDTAPRDPATLKVTKEDGNATYDPASPSDARVHAGVRQILLNVQSTAPPQPEDANTVLSDTISGPGHNRSATFDVNSTLARVTLNFTVTNPSPAPTIGLVSFVATDPNGTEVARWDYDPVRAGPEGRGTVGFNVTPAALGTYTMRVTGSGAGAAYSALAQVDYPEALFVHVVYTDVRVG